MKVSSIPAVTIQRAIRRQKAVKEFQALKRAVTKIQERFRGHQLRNKQLLDAAESGDISEVKNLLARGADVNATDKYGITALHWVATTEIVQLLLAKGADVNVTNKYGETPLYWAVRQNSEDIVKLLLKAGAKTDVIYSLGDTPLHRAAYKGYEEIVKLLLDFGVEVNATNKYGETALHGAAFYGSEDIVKALVIAGADVNVTNKYGRTALQKAKSYGRYDNVNKAIKEGKQKLISLYENQQCQLKKVVNFPIYLQLEDLEEPLLQNAPEKLNETQIQQAIKYIKEKSFMKKYFW